MNILVIFQFKSLERGSEALFSLIQGDDVYATFTGLDSDQAGDSGTVRRHMQIIVYSFVSLFTIIMLNLVIALFNSSYEYCIKVKHTLTDCNYQPFSSYFTLTSFYFTGQIAMSNLWQKCSISKKATFNHGHARARNIYLNLQCFTIIDKKYDTWVVLMK